MLTIGADAHKRLHVAVATDEAGRVVERWEGANSPDGWEAVTAWAQRLGAPRRWGIEGAGGYGQGLARHLVGLGEVVYEVNPRLTAGSRRGARRPGKSDAPDAPAVARVVLREGDDLPRVQAADEAAHCGARTIRPTATVHAMSGSGGLDSRLSKGADRDRQRC